MAVVSGGVDVAEFGDQFACEAARLDSWMDAQPAAPYPVQRAASEAHTLFHIFRSGLPVYQVGGDSLDEIRLESERMLVFDRGDAPTDNGFLAIDSDAAQFAVRTVTNGFTREVAARPLMLYGTGRVTRRFATSCGAHCPSMWSYEASAVLLICRARLFRMSLSSRSFGEGCLQSRRLSSFCAWFSAAVTRRTPHVFRCMSSLAAPGG